MKLNMLRFKTLLNDENRNSMKKNKQADTRKEKKKTTLSKFKLLDPKVIINSDGNADFKFVVGVLDEVRKIGIAKVGINTDKK